jgi:hypothetical protein
MLYCSTYCPHNKEGKCIKYTTKDLYSKGSIKCFSHS